MRYLGPTLASLLSSIQTAAIPSMFLHLASLWLDDESKGGLDFFFTVDITVLRSILNICIF